MIECVVNISEGRDPDVLDALRAAAAADLLDLHADAHHHRSVLTLVGEEAPRRVATVAVDRIDLSEHTGAHPRLGAVDVVPFIGLGPDDETAAGAARDRFSRWAADELALPCFHYGAERTLPDVRRDAFSRLAPDVGPAEPHPTAGAVAVGCRGVLVAYNAVLADPELKAAQRIARKVRSPQLRALGLQVGDEVQVSMNLVDPRALGPADAYDLVSSFAPVQRAELVGLMPADVLAAVPPDRWEQLDLARDRTIEARLADRARNTRRRGD